jgi:hypothetical protein
MLPMSSEVSRVQQAIQNISYVQPIISALKTRQEKNKAVF